MKNVFTEQSKESALGPEYALAYKLFYKYKPSLIQTFEMKDLPFNGESAFQHTSYSLEMQNLINAG